MRVKMPSKYIMEQFQRLPEEKQRQIRRIAATLSIEDMYLTDAMYQDMIDRAAGRKTAEEIRRDSEKRFAHGQVLLPRNINLEKQKGH